MACDVDLPPFQYFTDQIVSLKIEIEKLKTENKELKEILTDYVKEDDTYEGGKWEELNKHWLDIKRRAIEALKTKP